MTDRSEPHTGEWDQAVLVNLVRRYAWEIVERHRPELLPAFPWEFELWRRGEAPRDRRRGPVARLCDLLLRHFRGSGGDDRDLDKIIAQWGGGWEIRENLQRGRYELRSAQSDAAWLPAPDLVGSDPAWLTALDLARRAARCDFPVLIQGESGTGKELVARAVHNASARMRGPLVVVNCAALPEALTESELFGYGPGAFTGADPKGRRGRIESAAGGTLVLDEVADLSPHAQAALLRTLQFGEMQKLGGGWSRADFRLIALSNRNLEEEAQVGRFRRDLFYRIAVVVIELPPLRRRPADILPLAEHFLAKFQRSSNFPPTRLSASSVRRLKAHPWPGNVRELENVISRAMVLSGGGEIQPEHLVFNTPPTPTWDEWSLQLAKSGALPIGRINPRQLRGLFDAHPEGVSTAAYARHFQCGETTARRHLESLARAGLVARVGTRRAARYTLSF